jgi:cell fate regulator YaaT (PSP1 superfamily)
MGHIGRFRATNRFKRGTQVICRTPRGLEQGEVLAADSSGSPDGDVLRKMTTEDHLLSVRLQKNATEALAACQDLLDQVPSPPALLDAELLFDGQGLYFYFLGEVSTEVDAMTDKLAAAFEAKAQIARFSDTLDAGCGPDCGTEEGGGCGTDSCGSCAVAQACKK